MPNQPTKIAVMLSTYNGALYLSQQIDSLLNQDIPIDIFIRDDGSTDKTIDILKEYEFLDCIHISYGPNLGYKKSFMTMLTNIGNYDYYAFCDQDDIWLPGKLSSAIRLIDSDTCSSTPALYYSNLKKCDKFLNVYKETNLDKRVMSLQSNILRRSIAGCTIVINNALQQLVTTIGIKDRLLLQGHDSYLVSLCYAVNGSVICDANSYILYRQHNDNTSGSTNGIFKRIKKELSGLFDSASNEYTLAKAMIECCGDIIFPENMAVLKEFVSYKTSLATRFKIMLSPKYTTGNLVLTILGKIKVLLGIL